MSEHCAASALYAVIHKSSHGRSVGVDFSPFRRLHFASRALQTCKFRHAIVNDFLATNTKFFQSFLFVFFVMLIKRSRQV